MKEVRTLEQLRRVLNDFDRDPEEPILVHKDIKGEVFAQWQKHNQIQERLDRNRKKGLGLFALSFFNPLAMIGFLPAAAESMKDTYGWMKKESLHLLTDYKVTSHTDDKLILEWKC